MDFISIGIDATCISQRSAIEKGVRHFVAPDFNQTECDNNNATLRGTSVDHLNKGAPLQRFFQSGQSQRQVDMRIKEHAVTEVDNAFTREFRFRIERPDSS